MFKGLVKKKKTERQEKTLSTTVTNFKKCKEKESKEHAMFRYLHQWGTQLIIHKLCSLQQCYCSQLKCKATLRNHFNVLGFAGVSRKFWGSRKPLWKGKKKNKVGAAVNIFRERKLQRATATTNGYSVSAFVNICRGHPPRIARDHGCWKPKVFP